MNSSPYSGDQPVSTRRGPGRLLVAGVSLLACGYLLQLASPLRINTDSYRLLSMAVSAYHGEGYLVDGHVDEFPVGYPFVVKTLLQTGLANSLTLVALNLVCLFAGVGVLYACAKAEAASAQGMLAMAFALASWIMIKHVTLPMSDLLYFGLSSVSLFCAWLFSRSDKPGRWWWLAAGVVLAYLALRCRAVGIALMPALALTVLLRKSQPSHGARVPAKNRRALLWATTLSLCVLVVAIGLWKTGWHGSSLAKPEGYAQSFQASTEHQSFATIALQNIRFRLLEFGEIFTNLPASKASRLFPIIYSVGLVAWLAVLRGSQLLLRSRHLTPFVVYFFSYAVLILVWPFYDPRFWLPVLPVLGLLALAAGTDVRRRWPVTRIAGRAYLFAFLLLGFVAILFSTRISLAGARFSEVYGDGTSQMTYRYAFQNGKDVDMTKVNQRQLKLLRLFEPLAAVNRTEDHAQPSAPINVPQR